MDLHSERCLGGEAKNEADEEPSWGSGSGGEDRVSFPVATPLPWEEGCSEGRLTSAQQSGFLLTLLTRVGSSGSCAAETLGNTGGDVDVPLSAPRVF